MAALIHCRWQALLPALPPGPQVSKLGKAVGVHLRLAGFPGQPDLHKHLHNKISIRDKWLQSFKRVSCARVPWF